MLGFRREEKNMGHDRTAYLAAKIYAIAVRHHDVKQYHVRVVAFQMLPRLPERQRRKHLVAL
jgi:hypothetical protein